MTKRGGILLAVAALVALTGCSTPANEPSAATATVTASASPSASAPVAKKAVVNPNEKLEKQFAEFAILRAGAHGISDEPSEKEIVSGLRAFCEDGNPFKLSKSKAYNENMDMVADTAYCGSLTK